jgi:hypothetical protein
MTVDATDATWPTVCGPQGLSDARLAHHLANTFVARRATQVDAAPTIMRADNREYFAGRMREVVKKTVLQRPKPRAECIVEGG